MDVNRARHVDPTNFFLVTGHLKKISSVRQHHLTVKNLKKNTTSQRQQVRNAG